MVSGVLGMKNFFEPFGVVLMILVTVVVVFSACAFLINFGNHYYNKHKAECPYCKEEK